MAGAKRMKLLLVTLFLGAVISCGGGDGGGDSGYSNASLDGVYYGSHFSMNTNGWRAAIISATFDGAGVAEMDQQFAYLELPAVEGEKPEEGTGTDNPTLDYAVNADGAMQIGPGIEVTDGLVGSGANTFVVSRINADNHHSVGFFVTAPAPGSWDGTLSGDYHAVGFSPRWTEVTRVTFEPEGNFSSVGYYTGDDVGDVRIAKDNDATYEGDADGKVTLTGGASGYLIWFSADRTLFVGASATDPDDQKIHVGMKAGSGHTAASLRGTYAFGTLISTIEVGGEVGSAALGTLTFDGVEGVTVHAAYNGGGDSGQLDKTGSYKVFPDGTFRVQMEGETVRDGVMSADGKTIAFARMDSPTEHSIGVGVRR